MQTSIKLISDEESRRPFWQQYWQLKAALKKTKAVLEALGVTHFPEELEFSLDDELEALDKDRQTSQVTANKYSFEQPVSLVSRIREACMVIKTNIHRDNVSAYIADTYPGYKFNPVSVSAMLNNSLVKQGVLKMVRKGVGGHSSIYELADEATSEVEDDDGL